jgi:hypothetical protein
MSRLYSYFLSCWNNSTVNEEGLQTAVSKGLLTQDEMNSIMVS